MVAKNSVGIAFAHHYISRQSPTLIVHLYFLQVFLYVLFVAQKAPKTPGTGKISHNSLLLASHKRHPSAGCYLPQTAVRSSIGDKTTRLSRNNSITYMHRSNKFCPVSSACTAVRCDFDGAGLKILPLYAL